MGSKYENHNFYDTHFYLYNLKTCFLFIEQYFIIFLFLGFVGNKLLANQIICLI